jgi:hypothetical protein
MSATALFYDAPPRTYGLDRLDMRGDNETGNDWSDLRDMVQGELARLDIPVRAGLRSVETQTGWNRGGGANLFAYRTYDAPNSGIDPVVVGVTILSDPAGESYVIRGDIAGETIGDIVFEVPAKAVVGWDQVARAARDVSQDLAARPNHVLDALRDSSRKA